MPSIFSSKILCPFCFNYVSAKDLLCMCTNAVHSETATLGGHIIQNAKPDRQGYCTCDQCPHTTSRKACPKCKALLPLTITESPTRIISIVGAASSGKSYYVGSILRKIMEEGLFSELNFSNISSISTLWGDKKSSGEYSKRFKGFMDHFRILEPTKKISDLVKDNPPLLIEMSLAKKRLERNTFSFFDAAGESFHDAGDLASITPYIAHSEAVILILDPRQIPSVNSAISAAIPGLPAVSNVTYVEILNNVAQIIRDDNRLSRNKKIKIPLCIAFSKWDLAMETPGLIPDGLNCKQSSQNVGKGYDEQRIDSISSEIRSLLMQQWGEANLVSLAEQNFETVKYFSFSAWGSSNSGKSGAPAIASFRIEDPFLWILHNNKII